MAENKRIAFEIEVLGHNKTVQNIAEVEVALDKVKQRRKELKKAYDEGLLSEKKYTEQLTKITAETKVLQKQKNDLNKALRDEQKARDLNVGSMAHFRIEIKNLQKELDNHVRGVTISEEAYDKLYQTVAKGRKEIVDFDQGLNDGRSNVGRYKDSLLDLVGGFGEIGGLISSLGKGLGGAAIFGAVAAGAIAAGSKVKEIVDEFSLFRDEIALLSNETGDELDKVVIQIDKIANTYNKSQDELIEATKNFAQQYGISFSEASALIEEGFQNGADSSGKFLDTVKEYPSQFREAGLSAKDFIDAATANELLGFYDDKGVDAVKEFALSVKEQANGTQEAFQKAFGVEFSNKFFKDIDEGTISAGESIEVFVNKIRESNLPIKEQQTLIADVFRGAGEDAAILSEVGLEYLETVTDMRNGTKELTVEQQQYLERTNNLADANERLSTAKNELTKRLADESGAFNVLQTEAQAFLIETLNELIDAFAPVIDTFGDLFSTIGEYYDLLFDTGEATSDVSNEGTILGDVFDVVAGVLTFVVEVFTEVLNAVMWGIENIPILSTAFDILRTYVQNWVNVMKNLPSIFKGIIAGAHQMKDNVVNGFKDIILQLRILRLEAEKYNPFGDTSDKIDAEISKLKAKRKEIAASGKSVGDAFQEAYQGSIENIETSKALDKAQQEAAVKEQEAKAKAEIERSKTQKTKKELEKAAKEAAKVAERERKAAEKEAERLAKEREREEQRQIKAAEKLAAELQKVHRQATEAELQNLQDGIDKEKKLLAERFFNDIEDLNARLIEKEELSETEIAFNEQIQKLIEQRQEAHRVKLLEIDKKYSDKAQKEYEETYKFKAEQLDKEAERSKEIADATITNEKELAEAKKKIALDVAQEKLKLLEAELQSSEVINQTQLDQLKALQSEIQSLQSPVQPQGLTENVNSFRETTGEKITTGIGDLFGTDDEGSKQIQDAALGLADDIFNGIADAKAAQIQNQLEQDLAYYESRAEMELETLEAQKEAGLITEEQYAAQKQAIQDRADLYARRASERAVEEEKKLKKRVAIINAAAAVLNVLATTPFPASLIAAAAIGVKTAFEINAINKAEKGMYLDKGRLHSQGGELVEIEKGEAVINRQALASNDVLNLTGTPLEIADSLNTYKGTGVSFLKKAGIKTTGTKLPTLSNGGFSGKVPMSLMPRYVQQQKMSDASLQDLGDSIASKIAKEVNDKQVFVTTKDIAKKQNEEVQVKNNSTWLKE